MSQASCPFVSQLLNSCFKFKKKKKVTVSTENEIIDFKCSLPSQKSINHEYHEHHQLVNWTLQSQMRRVHMQVFTNTESPKFNQWSLKWQMGSENMLKSNML